MIKLIKIEQIDNEEITPDGSIIRSTIKLTFDADGILRYFQVPKETYDPNKEFLIDYFKKKLEIKTGIEIDTDLKDK